MYGMLRGQLIQHGHRAERHDGSEAVRTRRSFSKNSAKWQRFLVTPRQTI